MPLAMKYFTQALEGCHVGDWHVLNRKLGIKRCLDIAV
jgi:hypothetical protein